MPDVCPIAVLEADSARLHRWLTDPGYSPEDRAWARRCLDHLDAARNQMERRAAVTQSEAA